MLLVFAHKEFEHRHVLNDGFLLILPDSIESFINTQLVLFFVIIYLYNKQERKKVVVKKVSLD